MSEIETPSQPYQHPVLGSKEDYEIQKLQAEIALLKVGWWKRNAIQISSLILSIFAASAAIIGAIKLLYSYDLSIRNENLQYSNTKAKIENDSLKTENSTLRDSTYIRGQRAQNALDGLRQIDSLMKDKSKNFSKTQKEMLALVMENQHLKNEIDQRDLTIQLLTPPASVQPFGLGSGNVLGTSAGSLSQYYLSPSGTSSLPSVSDGARGLMLSDTSFYRYWRLDTALLIRNQ